MNIVEMVKQYAIDSNMDIYMVGGAVRDKIIGKAISDYDFAVSGDCHKAAKDIAENLNASYVNMHKDVARIVEGKNIIDFSILKGDSIYEDLSKRDFTINSIAIDLKTGKTIDVNNGLKDIENRIIRHTYDNAFDDDPIRLLRGVRLLSSLNFEISCETKNIIKEKSHIISNSAGERILDELYKILECEQSHKYIEVLDELNILKYIFPIILRMKEIGQCKYHIVDSYTHSLLTLSFLEREIENLYKTKWGERIKEHLNEEVSGRSRLCTTKLGAFLHDIGKPGAMRAEEGIIKFNGHDKTGEEEFNKIARRINMSQSQRLIVKAIITEHMRVLGLYKQKITDRAIYRLFRDLEDNVIDVLICSLFDLMAARSLLDEREEILKYWSYIMDLIDRYYTSKEKKPNLVTGRDVMELVGAEGKEIGEILKKVDEEIFYGNIKTREEALSYLKSYQKNGSSP